MIERILRRLLTRRAVAPFPILAGERMQCKECYHVRTDGGLTCRNCGAPTIIERRGTYDAQDVERASSEHRSRGNQ